MGRVKFDPLDVISMLRCAKASNIPEVSHCIGARKKGNRRQKVILVILE